MLTKKKKRVRGEKRGGARAPRVEERKVGSLEICRRYVQMGIPRPSAGSQSTWMLPGCSSSAEWLRAVTFSGTSGRISVLAFSTGDHRPVPLRLRPCSRTEKYVQYG